MPFPLFLARAHSAPLCSSSGRASWTARSRRLARLAAVVASALPLLSPPPARAQPLPSTGTLRGGALGGSSEGPELPGGRPIQGPLPVDVGLIRRVRVAGAAVNEAPMRVGNLDVLAPIADKLEGLGSSASEPALRNLPGNPNTPTGEQYFQINLYNRSPIVMAVGKSVAYIDHSEQPLRAAPLIIGGKLWLPLFSLAPLMGAACRLDPTGTLHFNPTIQSVELFQVRGQTVLTVKASAPLRPDSVLIGTLDGPPKIYLDFPGFSMGFDVSNSTGEKVLAGGLAEVSKVRGGLFEKFPDTTRIVLDLKQKSIGTTVQLPDRSLFALQLQSAVLATNRGPSPLPGPIPSDIPLVPGSLRGLTIVVDAGHGGSDNGAPGAHSLEKTHTLDIARRLKQALEDRGATVLMTRDSDVKPELHSRPQFANQRNADLFISVHINSWRSNSSGTETYYYTAPSLPLAREVHAELVKSIGLLNRGVKSARFVVIREANMPAILTETAFISNPREEALLMQDSFRQRAAMGMARGIQNYVDKYLSRAAPG